LRINRAPFGSFGREPTLEEIARELDMPISKVRYGLSIIQPTISLERPVGNDGDTVVKDLIEDAGSTSPLNSALRVELARRTRSALEALSPREAKILQLRFGVGDGRQHTLDEIGRVFMLTRERIRQIESTALAKLRRHSDTRALKDLLSG
jgi:RNA polymerase primary sigma factor